MANPSDRSKILSEPELIDWLGKESRTFGWDALVLYDRMQANRLLLQEYIKRYAVAESMLPPVSAKVELVEGEHWEYLYDIVLDAPRLSFERSTLGDPRSTLALGVVGGLHLSVRQPPNEDKRVTRIDAYDPIQGPRVLARIRLNDADQEVALDNKVTLDLSSATEVLLTLGSSGTVQADAGKSFQAAFAEWPRERKIFVLNTLEPGHQSEFLEPGTFRVLSLPAPESDVLNSEHYGEGAVMVLVAAKGSPVGMQPDPGIEWVYPIPRGRSFALLISRSFLLTRLLKAGAQSLARDVEYVYGPGESIIGFFVNRGQSYWHYDTFNGPISPFDSVKLRFEAPLSLDTMYGDAHFQVDSASSALKVAWNGSNATSGARTLVTGGPAAESRALFDWDISVSFSMHVNVDGQVFMEADPYSGHWNVRMNLSHDAAEDHKSHLNSIEFHTREWLRQLMLNAINKVASPLVEVDHFRVHSLIFQSGEIASVSSAHVPLDVALFGAISPASTSFALEPLEHVILAGSRLEMTTIPARTGLTWTVERVPGYGGGTGTIDARGVFEAPVGEEFEGAHTLLRISAAAGEYRSSALVRVVKRVVAINPLVVTAAMSSGEIRIAAGAVDGSDLIWSIVSETGATLSDAPPNGAGVLDPGDRFYLPGTVPSGKCFSVDQVTVTHASGESAKCCVLVIERMLVGAISIRPIAELPPGKLRFELRNGDAVLPGPTWRVIAGAGEIDADGTYTIDQMSPCRFSVITASLLAPIAEFNAYMILPLPMIDLDAPLENAWIGAPSWAQHGRQPN